MPDSSLIKDLMACNTVHILNGENHDIGGFNFDSTDQAISS